MKLLDRGIGARVVESSVFIAAPLPECWRFLTEPDRLAGWFADTVPLDDGTVDLQFGDGDFFRMKTTSSYAVSRLCWKWRFMGVGSPSEVEFRLCDEDGGTRVSVRDHGQYSEAGVHGLEEGWADFLSRLRRRIETGKNARFEWSETIEACIVVQAAAGAVLTTLRDPLLWTRFFRDAEVRLEDIDCGIQLAFRRKEWGGVATDARISLSEGAPDLHVSVCHEGWLQLPENCRISARRKFAGSWAEALQHLESVLADY